MTLLENTLDKIDRLDLNFDLKYEIKKIILDHISNELKIYKQYLTSAPSFDAEKFVNQICGRSSFNTSLSNLTEPETINHKK